MRRAQRRFNSRAARPTAPPPASPIGALAAAAFEAAHASVDYIVVRRDVLPGRSRGCGEDGDAKKDAAQEPAGESLTPLAASLRLIAADFDSKGCVYRARAAREGARLADDGRADEINAGLWAFVNLRTAGTRTAE